MSSWCLWVTVPDPDMSETPSTDHRSPLPHWSSSVRVPFVTPPSSQIATATRRKRSSTFGTGLPCGSYCNILDGLLSHEGACTGAGASLTTSSVRDPTLPVPTRP
ncbi:hypothetical protein EDB84DRAFT_1571149 [Lactarius hengduanensis]|nr:hypothetical protein EDB84DRAFT_1571149 [Lactarius hengduanensis]